MSNSTSSSTGDSVLFLLDRSSDQLDSGSNVLRNLVRLQSSLSARCVACTNRNRILHCMRSICLLWRYPRVRRSPSSDSILAPWSLWSIRHSLYRIKKCRIKQRHTPLSPQHLFVNPSSLDFEKNFSTSSPPYVKLLPVSWLAEIYANQSSFPPIPPLWDNDVPFNILLLLTQVVKCSFE